MVNCIIVSSPDHRNLQVKGTIHVARAQQRFYSLLYSGMRLYNAMYKAAILFPRLYMHTLITEECRQLYRKLFTYYEILVFAEQLINFTHLR